MPRGDGSSEWERGERDLVESSFQQQEEQMLKDNQVQAITTILKDLESKEQDITIGLLLKGLQRMEAEERHRMAQFVVGGEPESALVSRERLDKITEFFHVLYEHPVVKDRLAARKKKESDDLSGEIAAILLG